jgi:hypothetical protein
MIGGFNTQPTSFSHLIHHLRMLRYINPSSSLLSGPHMIPCSRSHSFWIDRFLGRLYAPIYLVGTINLSCHFSTLKDIQNLESGLFQFLRRFEII